VPHPGAITEETASATRIFPPNRGATEGKLRSRFWGCLSGLNRGPSAIVYLRAASTIQRGDSVGMTLVILSPAASNNSRNSVLVLSLPPFITSMFKSSNLLNETSCHSGTTHSTTRTLPCRAIDTWQFRRTHVAWSSSQS
jgi:hypothetical protein